MNVVISNGHKNYWFSMWLSNIKKCQNLENHKHPIDKLFSISFIPITMLFTSSFVSTDNFFNFRSHKYIGILYLFTVMFLLLAIYYGLQYYASPWEWFKSKHPQNMSLYFYPSNFWIYQIQLGMILVVFCY